ncbi:MAG: DNA primase [Opitutales bacterium]|nr:DNA primase [Opitutales bacterium]
MPKIKQSSIEEVRARVSLVDLISPYTPLKKSGAAYKGLSPFASEKTPSFFVYPDKGFYYCFSTSQGGDLFKFIQVKENMSFPEAVEFIAQRFSIPLEYEAGSGGTPPSRRKQLFDIHEDAADWYSRQFFADTPQAEEIRKYWIEERGFTLEDAKELRIGFAPADAAPLKKLLLSKKYEPEAILGSGIFAAREGERNVASFYPRFRGRMMIPICDIQGRVIAFTARKTRFTPDVPSEEGKYVNSRDTDIFRKNLVVFNMDKAKNFAKEKNCCIVVEGQLDAIRMYCAGFKNTVATQGTAAGKEHFALIKRYADKVTLLFDGDAAGQHAALRVIPLCFQAELEPFVAVIPDNDDPDSFIKKRGADTMRELAENKKRSGISFAARALLADNPSPTPQDRRTACVKLFEMLLSCHSKVLLDDYMREISASLAIDYSSLAADFAQWKKSAKNPQISEQTAEKNVQDGGRGMLTNSLYDALLVCLHYGNIAECMSGILEEEWLRGDSPEARALAKLMALHREGVGFEAEKTAEYFDADDEQNLVYEILSADKSAVANPVKYANECIKKIYKNFYSGEIKSLEERLLEAESKGSDEKFEILKKLSRIRRESRTPPSQLAEENAI